MCFSYWSGVRRQRKNRQFHVCDVASRNLVRNIWINSNRFEVLLKKLRQSCNVHARKADRGSRDIALLILNFGAGWRWIIKIRLRQFYLREGTPVHMEEEAAWATEPFWTFWRKKVLHLPRFEPLIFHPVTLPLYRLRRISWIWLLIPQCKERIVMSVKCSPTTIIMSAGSHCDYSCFHQPLFRTATLGDVEYGDCGHYTFLTLSFLIIFREQEFFRKYK